MAEDRLLDLVFSDLEIWENAITDGDEKKIRTHILENFSDPLIREDLKADIAAHKIHIKPPHEAQIPKDDGTMRTVYVNENKDRILLTVINNIFFKYCKEMVHPKCLSYQIGIGCGKIDKRVVKDIQALDLDKLEYIGYKIDLSKYFDSVPLNYIDEVFDRIEDKFGRSSVMDLVREYYHSDILLDMQRNEIHKYTSLRQGCAIAAFLADSVLYDIDDTISKMNVIYYRYSDDILILGEHADKAFEMISDMLNAKSLTLNPKKVEHLDKDHWFTFLGFSIKGDQITLSKKRIKNLQKAIENCTIRSKNINADKTLHKIYRYLYDTTLTPYGYAEGILPVINNEHDIKMIDEFIIDCIRACGTKRLKIGGLGYDKTGKNGVIIRGRGRNVSANRKKIHTVENYVTLSYMQILFNTNRNVYDAYVQNMML